MTKMLTEKDLANLDKQTLIDMLMATQSSVHSLEEKIEQNNQTIALLTEEVANLRQHRFGRSSERGLTDQIEGQMSFAFNEAEWSLEDNPAPEEPAMETVIIRRKSKKTKGQILWLNDSLIIIVRSGNLLVGYYACR